jgi:hypothetical protein
MTILLDIDGVLVTTPSWKVVEQLPDGFLKFNETAARNLARIIEATNASIVLTTTHRINYSVDKWKELFEVRGIHTKSIEKVNEVTSIGGISRRAIEIKEWVDKKGGNERFVVIDDDLSINDLSVEIRKKCVLTKPLIGLDDAGAEETLKILLEQ